MNEYFLSEWFGPYIFSNVLASIIAFMAWKRPSIAKYMLSVLFLTASLANTLMVLRNPLDYKNYSEFAWPVYRDFIQGSFSSVITPMVLFIAFGQLLLGIGFLCRGKALQLAATGALIFFVAITPLGLGAAFPFTIIAGIGCVLILQNARDRSVSKFMLT